MILLLISLCILAFLCTVYVFIFGAQEFAIEKNIALLNSNKKKDIALGLRRLLFAKYIENQKHKNHSKPFNDNEMTNKFLEFISDDCVRAEVNSILARHR